MAEKSMAKIGASPELIAKAVQLQKALADKGAAPDLIAEAICDLLNESGAQAIPNLQGLLQGGITPDDVAKIISMSQSFVSGSKDNSSSNIPNNLDASNKEALKEVMKQAFGNDLDKLAKTVLGQKAFTASGASPETVAKVAFLAKSMAENGMPTSEIANALTMAICEIANALTMAISMPDGPDKDSLKEMEAMLIEIIGDPAKGGLTEEDIKMLLSLSDAMSNVDLPPEAIRLFQKAMKQRRGSVDNVAETLMSSLAASGDSKENVAKAMIKALKATGASPEEIARTMQQAMEKAGATPEEMAKVLAQALAESGASRKSFLC